MSTSAAGGPGMEAYEAPVLTEFGTIEELTRQIDISIILFPED